MGCEARLADGAPCRYKARFSEGTRCGVHRDMQECSVCLDVVHSRARLTPPCGHAFHATCLRPWLRTNPTCPLCRGPADACGKRAAVGDDAEDGPAEDDRGWLAMLWLCLHSSWPAQRRAEQSTP